MKPSVHWYPISIFTDFLLSLVSRSDFFKTMVCEIYLAVLQQHFFSTEWHRKTRIKPSRKISEKKLKKRKISECINGGRLSTVMWNLFWSWVSECVSMCLSHNVFFIMGHNKKKFESHWSSNFFLLLFIALILYWLWLNLESKSALVLMKWQVTQTDLIYKPGTQASICFTER